MEWLIIIVLFFGTVSGWVAAIHYHAEYKTMFLLKTNAENRFLELVEKIK